MTGVALQLALCLAALPPPGEPPLRVLLDRRLQERVVRFTGMDDRTISYVDEGGLVRTEPFTEFVALLPERAEAPAPPRLGLWLTDGQRFAGDLRPGAAAPGVVRWEHPSLGPLDVSLEAVSRIELLRPGEVAFAPTLPPPTGQDVVTLTNGDILAGFVESVGDVVEIEVDGAIRAAPRNRVVRVALAARAESPSGTNVWLADGTILAIDGVHTSPAGVVRLHPVIDTPESPGSEAAAVAARGRDELLTPEIAAVLFDAARVTPLASLAPLPSPEAGAWSAPLSMQSAERAILWAADITLPGVMTAEWRLPAQITRLSLTAELPPDMWTWGDCELVVSVVTTGTPMEVARERLHAEQASVPISADLPPGPGRTLRITLGEGRYGPIQDRVVLRRALLLTAP